jgi:signal peptidase I
MAPSPASARRAVLATAGGLGRVLLGLVCLVLIATLIPPLLGYQRYVVVGGSMEPSIHRGSIIFDEIVPVEDLRPGDVITYVPPGRDTPSTHRIVSRELDPEGSWRFRTKGDANADADAQPFVLERPVQARVKVAIPYVGHLWMALASQQLRYALLVAPAILIALWMLVSVWRDAGRMLERERA